MIGVTAGIVIGVAGATALSSVIASQLYEVAATDLRVFLAVVLFVGALAVVACWRPVRRICGVSPVVALRGE